MVMTVCMNGSKIKTYRTEYVTKKASPLRFIIYVSGGIGLGLLISRTDLPVYLIVIIGLAFMITVNSIMMKGKYEYTEDNEIDILIEDSEPSIRD